MEEKKVFREGRRTPLIIGAFAIMIMLTIGVGVAQYQTASVTNNIMSEKPCIGCEASFDGEDEIICPTIMPIMQQIIDGYESGNPVGQGLIYGYTGGAGGYYDFSESMVQSGSQYHSFDGIPMGTQVVRDIDDDISSIRRDTEILDMLSEEILYERALEMTDFCDFGEMMGDWFGSDMPGSCDDENKKALKLAALQCLKPSVVALGITSTVVSVILSSVTLIGLSVLNIAQILIAFGDYLPAIAQMLAQQIVAFYNACVDFWYPIFCGILG